MADTHTHEQRRRNMQAIKGKNTRPEIILRSSLHRLGYRFRIHYRDLPGRPDIVMPKHKTVIDVRGCFWHRHEGCNKSTMPGTNIRFWKEKFQRTVERDRINRKKLESLGWNVIVVWECEIPRCPEKREEFARRLMENVERHRQTANDSH